MNAPASEAIYHLRRYRETDDPAHERAARLFLDIDEARRQRDAALRVIRRRFFGDMKDNPAAEAIHRHMLRYDSRGGWRQARLCIACPHEPDSLEAMLWRCWTVLPDSMRLPSVPTLRRILVGS